MISKGEAITRLKKMGVSVVDDQSIVTILLPQEISLTAGIKDIKEKFKEIGYEASFCIKQKKELQGVDKIKEQKIEPMDEVMEAELEGSLLSMDEDGQFTLDGFGMEF